jgi:hypothetical protein
MTLVTSANAQMISTIFTGGNSNSIGGGNYFDVNVLNPAGLTVTSLDINTTAVAGTPFTINLWTRTGTSVGFETSMAGWTQVSTGSGVSNGLNVPSPVDMTDFTLAPGLTGFALNNVGVSFSYTNGNGANQNYANADVTLALGTATNVFLTAPIFTPRVWNGTIFYTTIPEPTSMALVGIGAVGIGLRRWRKKK